MFYYLLRHYRYEQKLACLLWKVDMKEVTLVATENLESSIRTKSLVRVVPGKRFEFVFVFLKRSIANRFRHVGPA